jgi:hypothetical protein
VFENLRKDERGWQEYSSWRYQEEEGIIQVKEWAEVEAKEKMLLKLEWCILFIKGFRFIMLFHYHILFFNLFE